MRLSELAQETGAPLSALKYYLRLGVLPPGEAVNARESSYGPKHTARVRLIRALAEVAGMPMEKIQQVAAVLDQESADLAHAFGQALRALPPYPDDRPTHPFAAALLERFGMPADAGIPGVAQLEAALRAAADAGKPLSGEQAEAYVASARLVARADVAPIARLPASDALAYAVVGTALHENVFTALRRVAHYEQFVNMKLTGITS